MRIEAVKTLITTLYWESQFETLHHAIEDKMCCIISVFQWIRWSEQRTALQVLSSNSGEWSSTTGQFLFQTNSESLPYVVVCVCVYAIVDFILIHTTQSTTMYRVPVIIRPRPKASKHHLHWRHSNSLSHNSHFVYSPWSFGTPIYFL